MLPPKGSSSLSPHVTNYSLQRNLTLCNYPYKTKSYGQNSLKYQGAKLWNDIPNDLCMSQSSKEFKLGINEWNPTCQCYSCHQCTLSS